MGVRRWFRQVVPIILVAAAGLVGVFFSQLYTSEKNPNEVSESRLLQGTLNAGEYFRHHVYFASGDLIAFEPVELSNENLYFDVEIVSPSNSSPSCIATKMKSSSKYSNNGLLYKARQQGLYEVRIRSREMTSGPYQVLVAPTQKSGWINCRQLD